MPVADHSSIAPLRMPSRPGEPAWEVAMLFPAQGEWTETQYLALNGSNRMVELSNGCLEVLPMPTPLHQRIVDYLFSLLKAFVVARGLGEVYFAPLPVRLWEGKFREPDIMFFRPGRIVDPRAQPDGVDLAMEVLSAGAENRERDLEIKRVEYAVARIPEYWIVDPELNQITVLCLDGESYRVHGVFAAAASASSVLLPGFVVDVKAVFAAGSDGQARSC
jgi:Uma2 family endonuclease